MSKYKYFAGVDVAYGDDKTVMSYFRQRQHRWWEKLIKRFYKAYEIKQPLELVDHFELLNSKEASTKGGETDE